MSPKEAERQLLNSGIDITNSDQVSQMGGDAFGTHYIAALIQIANELHGDGVDENKLAIQLSQEAANIRKNRTVRGGDF